MLADLPSVTAALLAADEVAQLLAVSPKSVRRMDLVGRLPRPVRLGRAVRWRHEEILDWVAAGCPPRDQWTWRPAAPDRHRRH